MATVFRKTYTQPLPREAEIVRRGGKDMACWRDRRGRKQYAEVTIGRNGRRKLLRRSPTFTAKYRNANGHVVEVSTGCKDETAARMVLARLEQRTEHIKAGVLTADQAAALDHQQTPIGRHLDDYLQHLDVKKHKGRRVCQSHRDNVKRYLRRIVDECGMGRLSDMTAEAVEAWMMRQESAGMGARTLNVARSAAVAFAAWCRKTRRLAHNPMRDLPRADESSDRRRRRRALTPREFSLLLDAARRQPALEAMTIRRGKNAGQPKANVRESIKADLARLGWERALICKTFVMTGLRKKELASITLAQAVLEGGKPHLVLHAKDAKNGKAARIPLTTELAADLREWIADRSERTRQTAHGMGTSLPPEEKLLNVPTGLVKILNRDLKLAGIAKTDARDRTIDVHSLRHTFCTWMQMAGVAGRKTQAAMRHSSRALTDDVYTDEESLDVAAAVEAAMPSLPLATAALAPALAPTGDRGGHTTADPGTRGVEAFSGMRGLQCP
ncbi:MAG: site-specific integrase [Planctomycetes bacterium]|nr:site-specific integrase [Planctomycetota bacterium]